MNIAKQVRSRPRSMRKESAHQRYVNVRKKSQITIPKELMEHYGIEEGDQVIMRFGKKGIEIIPARVVERDQVITEKDVAEAVAEGKKYINTGKGEVEGPFENVEAFKKALWEED